VGVAVMWDASVFKHIWLWKNLAVPKVSRGGGVVMLLP
jgi:hypothetical protein